MPIRRIWRPFTDEGIKTASRKPGVYELCDLKEEVVYIGSSDTSVRSRVFAHTRERKFVRVRYFRFMVIE